MSELDSIKSKPKVKRILKSITFPKGSHFAYTSEDQGGAASGKNNAYLFKANKKRPLTTKEKQILLELGFNESDLEKAKSDTSASTEENINSNVTENKGNIMSDEIIKSLEAKVKQIQLERKLEKAAEKYGLEDSEQLAVVLSKYDEEDYAVIFKCFDALAEKVNVEKAAKEAAIEKANSAPAAENPIRKAMQQEQGEGGDAPATPEDPIAERKAILKAAIEKQYEKIGVKN